ncbi:MAG: alpha-amylase family glycosyl hydrolase [Chloroflexota bacterium]
MKKYVVFLALLFLILSACVSEPEQPTPVPTVKLTETPEATAVFTSTPTQTPRPTLTPFPTNTPIPPTQTPSPLETGSNGYPWWNDVVFYEVFVRSFYDSNGDGVGDINGLIERLDYLNDGDPTTTDDLGVTGIWLMPVMVSPSYHGYDVTDYYRIDPEYGTNEDFKRLMDEAHKRGIRVVVDLVLNHTGVGHPWFAESKDPSSDRRDWYLWETTRPTWRGPDGQIVWHPDGSNDQYYYGVFWDGMPDLNYENPDVTAEMYETTRFWLEEMGVDGFRLDAIKHMIEVDTAQENTFPTHDWLEAYYDFYKSVDPYAFTVGEAWTATQQVLEYTGDEVDIAFQFDLALDILNGSDAGIAQIFTKTQQEVIDTFPSNQYATFITNHDQNRVMTQLDGDEGKARVAASILLTGTGVPFIYYGEEIGMIGKKPDEDIRRPMQWQSDNIRVGFTTGIPWRIPAQDYEERSVALQEDDPDSLLNHYKALIQLRNEHEALRVGDWQLVEANSGRLYTFLRYTDNETILVIINLNRNPATAENYSLELESSPLTGDEIPTLLYGQAIEGDLQIDTNGGFSGYTPIEEVAPQSVTIILLEK